MHVVIILIFKGTGSTIQNLAFFLNKSVHVTHVQMSNAY